MATPAETLQALRVLFEAQVGSDKTLLESFDATAAPLKKFNTDVRGARDLDGSKTFDHPDS